MARSRYDKLIQLGKKAELPKNPQDAKLERVRNPHPDTACLIRFTLPEVSSICPVTVQLDFAYLVIEYVPGRWIVESKSLKLFLGGFRNHGAFQEDCTITVAKSLIELLRPKWLRMGGYWYP